MGSLSERILQKIRSEGPMSFRDFMEAALYDPDGGYYSTSVRLGRAGDFYTGPELDPEFARSLARFFAGLSGGTPDFQLIELGAGSGALARGVLDVQAFPYFILERSAAMREAQRATLAGRNVRWIDELPSGFRGCVFSNEFFDALPVHRFVRRGSELREIFVGDGFEEIETPVETGMTLPLDDGQVTEVCLDARRWLERIARSLESGFHVAIDYGCLADEFFSHRQGTLMCYREHRVHDDPYADVGAQDITAHVNFSDLMAVGEAHGLATVSYESQAGFLARAGLLETMQRLAWNRDGASLARLERLKKLVLPNAMGSRFKVLVQRKRESADGSFAAVREDVPGRP